MREPSPSSARLPTLRLRRPVTIRFVEAMACMRLPVAHPEWLPVLNLAATLAQQGQALSPRDVSSRLLPLAVTAARTWLERGVEAGMFTIQGSEEDPHFTLTALGTAAAQAGVATETRQGLFRFAVSDEPLLAGRPVLAWEERREESTGGLVANERELTHPPGEFSTALFPQTSPFAILRTSSVVRPLPPAHDLDLTLELELAPDQPGPFRLRLLTPTREGKGGNIGPTLDIRFPALLHRRADQSYAELLALVLAASATPTDVSSGLSVPLAALPTEARLTFRLRLQKNFRVHLKVPGQYDLGIWEVEPLEVNLVPRDEDVDAWGLWLQVRALGGERTPAAATRAGEMARQKIPTYRPRSLHELAAAIAADPATNLDPASRAALLEAYDLLLWETAS